MELSREAKSEAVSVFRIVFTLAVFLAGAWCGWHVGREDLWTDAERLGLAYTRNYDGRWAWVGSFHQMNE